MEEISSLLFVENIHLFLQPLWPRSLLYLYQYSVIRARSSTILHFFQFLHPALIVYFPYHLSYYPPFPFPIFLSCNNFQTGRQSSFVSLILKESPTLDRYINISSRCKLSFPTVLYPYSPFSYPFKVVRKSVLFIFHSSTFILIFLGENSTTDS